MKRAISIVFLFALALGVYAQDRARGHNPEWDSLSRLELVDRSWDTPSASEKKQIRCYLARAFPDTAEGKFAQAWLAGDAEEQIRLYREAAALDPRLLHAWGNLSASLGDEGRYSEELDALSHILEADPSFYGYYYLRSYFNILYFYIGDKNRAKEFRGEWEARLGPDHFVFAAMDYHIAYDAGDWAKAYEAVTRPVNGQRPYWYLEYARDLAASGKLGPVTQESLIEAWKNFLEAVVDLPAPYKARAIRECSEFIKDSLGDYYSAFRYAQSAFQIYPHEEAMGFLSGGAPSRFDKTWWRFQDEVLRTIPWSAEAYMDASFAISRHLGQDPRIEEYYKRAWEYSPDESTDWTIFANHIQDLEVMGLYGQAWTLLEKARFPEQYKERLGFYTYDNRRLAGDFQRAIAELDRFPGGEDPDKRSLYLQRRDYLVSALERLGRDPARGRPIVSGGFPSSNFTADSKGATLVFGGWPGEVWNARTGEKLFDLGRVGYDLEISPDDAYVATLSEFTRNDGTKECGLYVYDLRDGRLVLLRPSEMGGGEGLAWSPDSAKVSYVDAEGWINVFDRAKAWKLTRYRAGILRIQGPSVWLDNRRIAVGQAQSKSVRILDARTGELIKELSGVDWPHALGLARQGRSLACVDNRGVLSVWDLDSWSVRQTRLDQSSKRIVAHPTKPLIALEFMGRENEHVTVVDVSTMTQRASKDDIGGQLRLSGGRLLHFWGKLTYLDWETLEETEEIKPASKSLRDLSLTTDEEAGYAIIAERDTQFLDLETGVVAHRESDLSLKAKLGPGRWLAYSYDQDAYAEYSLNEFRVTKTLAIPEDAGTLEKVSDDLMLFSDIAFPWKPGQAARGKIRIYRVSDQSLVGDFGFPVATRPLKLGEMYGPNVSADLSSRGDLIAVWTSWQDGWGTDRVRDSVVRVFHPDGSLVNSIDAGRPIRTAWFDPGSPGELLVSVQGGRLKRYDAATGAYLRGEGVWMGTPIPLPGGRFLDWDTGVIRLGDLEARFDDNLRDVAAVPSRNLALGVTTQGEIRLLSLNKLEPVLSLYIRPDNEWIAFDTSGTYASSPGGRAGVVWRMDGRNMPLELSGLREGRTDILADALKRVREGSSLLKDDTLERIRKAQARASALRLVWDSPIPERTDERDLRLRLRVEGSGADAADVRVQIRLNSRLLTTESEGRGRFSKSVRLSPGINVIDQLLVVGGFTLAEDRREVIYDGPAAEGTLRILGVGVSRYSKSDWNLAFAAKDVSSFSQVLTDQAKPLYASVESRTIEDEKATRENVQTEIRDLFKRAGPDDTLVLVFSGHGLQTKSGQGVVFLTYDAASRETGYDFQELLDLMDLRPTTQRVILVLDLCHSGGLTGTLADRRQAVSSEIGGAGMSRNSGAVFLFSSQGYQSSLEGERFRGGHGAFMAFLMNALEGQADGNSDGLVDLVETSSYLEPQVLLATGGLQEPVIFRPPHLNMGLSSLR